MTGWGIWAVFALITVAAIGIWLLVSFWRAVISGRILLRPSRRQADIDAAMRRHPAGKVLDNGS